MSSNITLERLAATNPVSPGAIDIDDSTLLLAIHERSVAMSTSTERQATRGIPPTSGSEPPKGKRGWIVALAAFAVAIVVGAVGLLSTIGTDAPPAAPPTTEAQVDTATAPVTIQVEAFDYGYAGLDADIKVGDALELVNNSETEYHGMVVIRLDDDDSRTIDNIAALDPQDIDERTVVNTVGRLDAAPGSEAFNGRIRIQRPGRYMALDMVPQGADPDVVSRAVNPSDKSTTASPPYTIAGGLLGYQHGMIIEFEVSER